MAFYLNPKILQLVNEQGQIPSEKVHLIEGCIKEAEELARRLLGCTLEVKGKKFVLTNLELYYGGIGDQAHDWYRSQFLGKKGISREQALIQMEEGLRIYFNRKGGGNYKRMDIVVGQKGVVVSLLVRNVADESGNLVGPLDGAPNRILRPDAMNLNDEDFGHLFSEHPHINFHDTHEKYVKGAQSIVTNKRYISSKGYTGFEGPLGRRQWNFKLNFPLKNE